MMLKKIICISIIVIIVVMTINFFKNKNKTIARNEKEQIEEKTDISKEYVIDDCLDEWADYVLSTENEIEEVNSNINEDNTIYVLRNKGNTINVYFIDKNDEEILYKETEISIEYLPKEDIEKLKNGIEVIGIEELNKLLEDLE